MAKLGWCSVWAFGARVFNRHFAVGRCCCLPANCYGKKPCSTFRRVSTSWRCRRPFGFGVSSSCPCADVLISTDRACGTGCFRPVILLPAISTHGFGSIGEIEPLMAHELIFHSPRADGGVDVAAKNGCENRCLGFIPYRVAPPSTGMSRSSTKTPRRGSFRKLLPKFPDVVTKHRT